MSYVPPLQETITTTLEALKREVGGGCKSCASLFPHHFLVSVDGRERSWSLLMLFYVRVQAGMAHLSRPFISFLLLPPSVERETLRQFGNGVIRHRAERACPPMFTSLTQDRAAFESPLRLKDWVIVGIYTCCRAWRGTVYLARDQIQPWVREQNKSPRAHISIGIYQNFINHLKRFVRELIGLNLPHAPCVCAAGCNSFFPASLLGTCIVVTVWWRSPSRRVILADRGPSWQFFFVLMCSKYIKKEWRDDCVSVVRFCCCNDCVCAWWLVRSHFKMKCYLFSPPPFFALGLASSSLIECNYSRQTKKHASLSLFSLKEKKKKEDGTEMVFKNRYHLLLFLLSG